MTEGCPSCTSTGDSRSGFRRADGGEEINARFSLVSFPAQAMRDTFSLEGYEIKRSAYPGRYDCLACTVGRSGFGSLTMTEPVAWGEPFSTWERPVCGLRVTASGWMGLRCSKVDGELTGAMFVWWDGHVRAQSRRTGSRLGVDFVIPQRPGATCRAGSICSDRSRGVC